MPLLSAEFLRRTGRAEAPRIAVPGTAADHTAALLTSGYPGCTVSRRPALVAVPAIRHPLPRIAGHVVQTEGVRRIMPGRRCIGISIITWSDRQVFWAFHAVQRLLVGTVSILAQVLFIITKPETRIGAGRSPAAC
jgi:hypothetical protein